MSLLLLFQSQESFLNIGVVSVSAIPLVPIVLGVEIEGLHISANSIFGSVTFLAVKPSMSALSIAPSFLAELYFGGET